MFYESDYQKIVSPLFHCLSEKEGNLTIFSSSYPKTFVISEALCHLFSFLFISTVCRCLCGCSLYKEQISGICAFQLDRMICFFKFDVFYILEKVVLQLSLWIWMHSSRHSERRLFWRRLDKLICFNQDNCINCNC